jgi:hypothetical protein
MGMMGRMLIVAGLLLVVVGAMLTLGWRLPGDIVYRGRNTTFYFPIATCIVISIILSLVMWFLNRR